MSTVLGVDVIRSGMLQELVEKERQGSGMELLVLKVLLGYANILLCLRL